MHTTMPRRAALALTAATLTFAAAACGSDDDNDSADSTAVTTAAGATETTSAAGAAETTGSGSGASTDVDAFCEAELAAEQAVQSEDTSAAGPALEALVAAAPEEIKPTVEEVVANAGGGPGDPAFDEPYGEMIAFVKENCGFNELEVEGADYSFTGIPADVPAGPTIVTFTNTGEELHEVAFSRINDGVTETVQELLELPEEEALSKLTPVGGGFGLPGVTSFSVVDLSEPGRYLATCFIPEGLTPEVAEQMEASAALRRARHPRGRWRRVRCRRVPCRKVRLRGTGRRRASWARHTPSSAWSRSSPSPDRRAPHKRAEGRAPAVAGVADPGGGGVLPRGRVRVRPWRCGLSWRTTTTSFDKA